MRIARKRGITRCKNFTAGVRAYASRAANVSKSKVWITCPASHRRSSATPVHARMANGRPHRRVHVAITAKESTSRVVRGRVFEDIHISPLIDTSEYNEKLPFFVTDSHKVSSSLAERKMVYCSHEIVELREADYHYIKISD